MCVQDVLRVASDPSLNGKDPSEQRLGSKGLMARLGNALTKPAAASDADAVNGTTTANRSVASSVKGERVGVEGWGFRALG